MYRSQPVHSLALLLSASGLLFGSACGSEDPDPPAVTATGGMPAATGGMPAATGGVNSSGGMPAANGGTPAATGGMPAANGGAPAATGGMPAATGGMPAATGGMPAATGGMPAATGGMPAATGGMPAATGGMPAATGGTPSNMDWSKADAKEVIKSAGAINETLKGKLDHYADAEVGNPTIGLEGTGTPRDISDPIVVPPGHVYDGKGEVLTGKGLGNGSQDEDQRPYFILAPGATLKNVTIGKPGTEGIHMMGDNTLDNITWQDVGEDAASCRSYFPQNTTHRIINSKVSSCADKCFQINAPGTKLILKNITGSGVNKLVRQNEAIHMSVVLDNIDVGKCKTGVVMVNNSNCSLMHRDVKSTPLTKGSPEMLPWVEGASD